MFEDVTKNSTEERKQRARLRKSANPSQSLFCESVSNLFQTVGWRQHNVIIGTGRESSTEVVTLARFHYLRICPNQLEGETGESRESAEQVGRLGKATGGASQAHSRWWTTVTSVLEKQINRRQQGKEGSDGFCYSITIEVFISLPSLAT